MKKQTIRLISLILTLTFISTQALAIGPLDKDIDSASSLSPSLISDDMMPGRSEAGKSKAAGEGGPGAIGNGPALINLVLDRNLPPKAKLTPAEWKDLENKIKPAMQLAVSLYETGKSKIANHALQVIAGQTAESVRAAGLHKNLASHVYPFYAVRDGVENYLLGFSLDLFNREEKVGLAVDFIRWLYNVRYKNDPKTALRRTAQYIFHEFTPERTVISHNRATIDRTEHRNIYERIQGPIFGEDERWALGEDFRAFIDELHSGRAKNPRATAWRGIIAKKVAVVGDSQRARLAITKMIRSNIPVVAWVCDAPAVQRIPFLTGSSTHDAFRLEDVKIVGNLEDGNVVLKIGKQKEPMQQIVLNTGRGKDSASARTAVEILAKTGVDTVILDQADILEETEFARRGINVVVMDKKPDPQKAAIAIQALQSEGASRIGHVLREFADAKGATVQFGQMKIIRPNSTTLPATHRVGGAGQLRVSQSDLCQKELREGLGISREDEARVPKTLQFGYPIRQGLIMTAVVVINRQAQAYEIKDLFEKIAKRDGFFVMPEDDELLNTERIAGHAGLHIYGEPLVQATEDGRSIIQVSFIADPVQTQVEELVQILQGAEPRVAQAVRRYATVSKDVELSEEQRRLMEDEKTDLAKIDVSRLAKRYNRKWLVEESKGDIRDSRQSIQKLLPILLGRQYGDFDSVEFLADGAGNRLGIVAVHNNEFFATTLLSAREPEEVAALQAKYYEALREHVFKEVFAGNGAPPVIVRDFYQPSEKLSAVWGVRWNHGKKEFVLREILEGGDRVVARPTAKFRPYEPDELGVFVNGAGGRIGSQVTRIIAGDAIDLHGKAASLSGRLIPVGIGISGFKKDGRTISGAEAFAALVKNGDPATGPFIGEVHHGYENGESGDWVELTPKGGETIRIAVFSDRIFRDPENYPLVSLLFAGVPVEAVEATGIFTNLYGLNKYLWAGAERANITAPGSSNEDHWQNHTFVNGINSDEFNAAKKQTASASCTTMCASALNDMIEQVAARLAAGAELPDHLLREYRNPATGVAVTYHSYTGEELRVDGSYDEGEKTQGRVVAGGGAYLTPTGFAKAGKIVIPEVNATGDAIRGPWVTASILAQVIDAPGHWTMEDIKHVFEQVREQRGNAFRLVSGVESSHQMQRLFGELASMQAVVDERFIQITHAKDNWGRPRSIITLSAWYENEWGFSMSVCRFMDNVVRPARAAAQEEGPARFPERLSAVPEEGKILYSDRVFLDAMSDAELRNNFSGKTLIVRADYNIVSPLLQEVSKGKFEFQPEIIEDFRILATVPDLERLQKAGAHIVLTAHNGRFKDVMRNRSGYSLAPVAKRLSELLGTEVAFSPETIGSNVSKRIEGLKNGDILLLENLRTNPGEEAGSIGYAEELSATIRPDAYIFLGFGAAHRGKHASIAPLIDVLRRDKPGIPVIAGGLIHRELNGLKEFLNDEKAKDSAVAILGGTKPADKIEVMRNMILGHRVKKIAVVGAMSIYFYMAKGFNVGNSFLEDDVEEVEKSVQSAFEILRMAEVEGVEIVLPEDYRGLDRSIDKERPPADLKENDTRVIMMTDAGLPAGFSSYTVGDRTVARITRMMEGASWVVLNGTAGMVEVEAFRRENSKILAAIDTKVAGNTGTCALLLGGDGVAAFSRWARETYGADYLERISPRYTISTGGGASLELFSRLNLSGLEPLDIKVNKGSAENPKIAIYGNLKWRLRTQEGIREHLKNVVRETGAIKGAENVETVLFLPSDLANDKELFEIIKGSPIKLGVQNIRLPGESTNELTAEEAKESRHTHVLIGHSDRRNGSLTFDRKPEDNSVVNARLRAALQAGLTPIFLFGETLKARIAELSDQSKRWQFIDRQLQEGLAGVSTEEAAKIRFAIEPVWAIGKEAASSLYANVQLEHARSVLGKLFGNDVAKNLVLGYGGGTNERNIISYIARHEINFVVPGRTAAEPRSFARMIEQAAKFSEANGLGGSGRHGEGKTDLLKAEELTGGVVAKARSETEAISNYARKHTIDLGQYVVIMKKNLPAAVTGAKGDVVSEQLTLQYQRMKQHLNGILANGDGVKEVDTQDELINWANVFISQNLKVIILDDGALTNNLGPEKIAGKPSVNYCAVTADVVNNLGPLDIPFVNLNAMAMMGVGILYVDSDSGELFSAAYRAFHGQPVPVNILRDVVSKVKWIVSVLPKIIKLTSEIGAQQFLRKLVDAAA